MRDSGSVEALRVVVVEDDDVLREEVIVAGLRDRGFDAVGLRSAADLYRHLRAAPADIVVLDVGLPDESGFAVARRLRASSSIGIVMLTGLSQTPDRIRGLSDGADAYLAKPVSDDLLAATLLSLGRRLFDAQTTGAAAGWRLADDDWHLRAPDGRCLALSPSERMLMRRLLANDGTPVPRDRIIADLAGSDTGFDPHRLEMIVHRLRRKVRETVGRELPLRSIRGAGYLFTASTGSS